MCSSDLVAGITTTSGLSWKVPGRIGDSPVIGAGLYVDNDVGAAGATGRGEDVIKSCASYYIVMRMRDGRSPQEAGLIMKAVSEFDCYTYPLLRRIVLPIFFGKAEEQAA